MVSGSSFTLDTKIRYVCQLNGNTRELALVIVMFGLFMFHYSSGTFGGLCVFRSLLLSF